ncbi:MAG: polyribonucleotide nucleotidyltransferase [Spirochaetes bacterium]|nr:polyribonucleotide nucleotidyltransferase [Spirochaetota bacterium]
MQLNGKELILETGLMAKQASGSVVLRYGDITILATSTVDKEGDLSMDFFPLTVNYNEKYYAGGKIPGGFLKREGRPRDKEVLISRIIDRPIRPLFPEGFRNEVQVVPTLFSTDQKQSTDVFAVIASSASLVISPIPFDGPIAAVRMGYRDGNYIVNPTYEELDTSLLDIIVVGSKDAITMIEGEACEVSEEIFIAAVERAHKEIQPIIALQEELARIVKVQKKEFPLFKIDEELKANVFAFAREKIAAASSGKEKMARQAGLDAVLEEAKAKFADIDESKKPQIAMILSMIEEEVVRKAIVNDSHRPDDRALDEIRALDIRTKILPRVHGSGLFTRGQTQSLAIVTLGSRKDAQLIDDVDEKSDKTFMLHYNFPPFSVGETGRMGSPGRREIGHGNLAERSFNAVMPKENFPYTVRIVSEILESNGSSSMATICASSIALLDAGVQLKSNVAGIAMGLATYEGKHKVLTDIQGVEDHLGDMDFKVAGTAEGITAFQLDIKLKGISTTILHEALGQAKKARLAILESMNKVIAQAGAIAPTAPKTKTIKINPERIKDLIGPSGKNIKSITEATQSDVEISDDGSVMIFAKDDEWMQKTIDLIGGFTKEPDIGEIFEGPVKGIKEFGVFVEIMPGVEGMCHISELDANRVEDIYSFVQLGDRIKVKVMGLSGGKISLSRKATLPGFEDYTGSSDREGRGGGGDRGRDRDRGGDRGGRGGYGGGGRDRDRGGRR